MSEASFVRTDTPEGARFDVTPAPKAGAMGCLVAVCVIAAVALIFLGLKIGEGGVTFTAILWVPLLLGAAVVAVVHADKFPRVPVSLVVNGQGIRAGNHVFPGPEIAELILRHPTGAGRTYRAAPGSAGASIGQAAARQAQERSYALMVRLTSSSQPQVLAYGLTYDAGLTLLNDVQAVLRRR